MTIYRRRMAMYPRDKDIIDPVTQQIFDRLQAKYPYARTYSLVTQDTEDMDTGDEAYHNPGDYEVAFLMGDADNYAYVNVGRYAAVHPDDLVVHLKKVNKAIELKRQLDAVVADIESDGYNAQLHRIKPVRK